MAKSDEVRVVQSPRTTGAEAEAVLEYWTEERMEAAEPLPLPTVEEPARPASRGERGEMTVERPRPPEGAGGDPPAS